MTNAQPLPAAADEPAQAYACRLARRINLHLRFFCTDIGILRQEVIKGSTDAVHRIADYGGADPAPLLAATVQHTEGRLYTLNGQDLVRDSLRRSGLVAAAEIDTPQGRTLELRPLGPGPDADPDRTRT